MYLNKRQAAERLGIARETLDRLIRDKKLKCFSRKVNAYEKVIFEEEYIERMRKRKHIGTRINF